MDRQWTDRTGHGSPALSVTESEADDARLPWWKSATPELMLSLRFANGTRKAYPYHDLACPELISQDLLKLYFMHATVVVKGRNLTELADHIERHCVVAVREQHAPDFTVPEDAPYVQRIDIVTPNLEALARKPVG